MSRKRLLILAALLVVTAAVVLWRVAAARQVKPLVLSGTIEARDVEVGSLLGGRIEKVLVEEGSRVEADQPIIQFETDLIDLQIEQERARIAQAQANLAKMLRGPRSEEIASARAQAENNERERLRQKALFEEGIVGKQVYDAAETAARTAREAFLELQRGNRPEDIAAARAALQTEQRQLGYLERQRAESFVRAPAAGVIESMNLRPGDLVAANQPVAKMLEPSQLWIRVYVPEPQLGRVRVGQKAAVTVDTFPKRPFAGHVVEIRTQAEYTPRNVQTLDQRMDQVFGVKVTVDPTPELKPGMAATVRLEEEDSGRRK
ncbi:MAG TPA: HlyD family efflux transporter periplasmic adaptor subunit [Thermoanaerobaculia bacterium]|nr:HlyD family efflux transporter periplasmic adaptor subunit [Thermoanaerobaculia bacterium]